jgi:ectoine hydroxylase-related dioxygenase (phytanoyl-CoA dioxygenase family)
LGVDGWRVGLRWAPAVDARRVASRFVPQHTVTKNPHLSQQWAHAAVRSEQLLACVTEILGPDVAVENTFLMVKWPGENLIVPLHQDGVNDDVELDPARSVAVWLAITDTPLTSGCVEVLSGSHTFGYLPFEREQADGPTDTQRNRGLMVRGAADLAAATFTVVPLQAGEAVAFDMRLLHRSGSNDSPQPRLGLNVRYVAPDAFRRGDPIQRPGWQPIAGARWAEPPVP